MNVGLLIRKPASVFQRWAVGLQTQLTRRGHEWENLPLHQNRKMSRNPTCALHILDSIQPQETQKEIYMSFIEFEANYRSNGTYSPERIPCEAQKVWKLESNIGYSSSRAFNGAISFWLSPFCNAVVSSSNSVRKSVLGTCWQGERFVSDHSLHSVFKKDKSWVSLLNPMRLCVTFLLYFLIVHSLFAS